MRRVSLLVLLMLAGCDAGPSAVMPDGAGQSPAKPQPLAQTKAVAPENPAEEASMPIIGGPVEASVAPVDHSIAPNYGKPLPLPKGARAAISETQYGDWPLWSKNRKHDADDNAHYQFEKHGPEFAAKSYGDYLAMVHGFIHAPPAGTQTLKRKNGDTLMYDARGNVFAVMTKTGAPRTLFRPDHGADYWTQQKDIEAAKAAASGDGE